VAAKPASPESRSRRMTIRCSAPSHKPRTGPPSAFPPHGLGDFDRCPALGEADPGQRAEFRDAVVDLLLARRHGARADEVKGEALVPFVPVIIELDQGRPSRSVRSWPRS
jgi:hypothetical protein